MLVGGSSDWVRKPTAAGDVAPKLVVYFVEPINDVNELVQPFEVSFVLPSLCPTHPKLTFKG